MFKNSTPSCPTLQLCAGRAAVEDLEVKQVHAVATHDASAFRALVDVQFVDVARLELSPEDKVLLG